jgi:hypothetical protein
MKSSLFKKKSNLSVVPDKVRTLSQLQFYRNLSLRGREIELISGIQILLIVFNWVKNSVSSKSELSEITEVGVEIGVRVCH